MNVSPAPLPGTGRPSVAAVVDPSSPSSPDLVGILLSRAGGHDGILRQVFVVGISETDERQDAAEATGSLGSDIELELIRRRLLNYFLARGVERGAAEDLTQDSLATMVEILRREPLRYAREWIVPAAIRTAHNKLLNYWKKKSTRCEADGLPEIDPPAGDAYDPERAARLSELRAAIGRLGEDCRVVIHLKYFLRLSSREIVESLSRPRNKKALTENAVDIRTSRCLQQLRKEFLAGRPGARSSM